MQYISETWLFHLSWIPTVGGYSHYALGDMTGYSPRMIGLKPGYLGYAEALGSEEIWSTLER